MKKDFLIILVLAGVVYLGWHLGWPYKDFLFGPSNLADINCDSSWTVSSLKRIPLKNIFGGSFNILDASNIGEVSRDKNANTLQQTDARTAYRPPARAHA
jgi:hypothetical protein